MVKVNNKQTRRTFKMEHSDQKMEMQEIELVQKAKATVTNKKKVKQNKGPYMKRIHTMKGWIK